MKAERIVTGALVGALAAFAAGGLWAFFDPRSFYEEVALFEPFNEHLFHDVGAFQLGLATAAGLALAGLDGRRVALWGLAVAATMHTASHAIDNELGGRDSDVPLLAGLAALLLVAAVLASRTSKQPTEVNDAPAPQGPGLPQGPGPGPSQPQ